MEGAIEIRRDGDAPVYRQIIEQIASRIESGLLRAGDRLPTERELAAQLGISRGTISKAYDELARDSMIEVVQGRGCFVSPSQDTFAHGRKEAAIRLITETIRRLEDLRFTRREIGLFVDLILMEREQRLQGVQIASIDCNPEALSIFESQLRYLAHLNLKKFLLEEVLWREGQEERFAGFDLILTTSTHYGQLVAQLPGLKDRIMRAGVSPSQQTVIDLAKIPQSARVAVITRSQRFFEIISSRLQAFHIPAERVAHELEREDLDYHALLADRDVLIIPPDFAFEQTREFVQALAGFRLGGGQVVRFHYQIDRGTLIHIEERISAILNRKRTEAEE